MFNGCLTGLIVGFLLQPLEIIKSNIIINPNQCLKIQKANIIYIQISSQMIYSTEGINGFWRGTNPALLKIILANGIYFSVLTELLYNFNQITYNQQAADFLSSASARIFASVITNPIQILRTRVEVLGFNEYNSLYDGFLKIYKQEGIQAFSSGALTSILRDGPFAGIYFFLYRKGKKRLIQYQDFLTYQGVMFISGMFSGAIATIFTNPIDIIRLRLQYSKQFDNQKYKSIKDGFQQIYNQQGYKGFIYGLGPRLLRKPLTNSISFVLFETLNKFSNKANKF